jgi:hypothetical protein
MSKVLTDREQGGAAQTAFVSKRAGQFMRVQT